MRSTGPSVSEKRIDALPKIKREGEETAMSEFLSANLPYLLSGISVGGQYALIAIGYTMVYGILRLINFAHGDVFMDGGLGYGLRNRLPADLCFHCPGGGGHGSHWCYH